MINRIDFIKRIIRYALIFVLGITVMILGKKVAFGNDCTGCPEIANCPKNFECKR